MSQPRWTCPFLRHTNHSSSTMLSREPSEAGPRLRAPPWSKPLRFSAQVALRGTDSVGTAFYALPGPSSSGVWRAQSLRLVSFSASAAQLSGCTTGAPREADGDCPAPPEVLAKKPACSLVGKVSPGLRLPPSSPYGSGCLSPEGYGLQPAISVPSFVLCVVLVVSYFRAFRVVAIPPCGMLAQVSSLWLHWGHSGPIQKKHCSPHLPAQPPLASGGCGRLPCFSAGGVTVVLVICWF